MEDAEQIVEDLKAIAQTDIKDLPALVRASGASRAEFSNLIPLFPDDEQEALVSALSSYGRVYKVVGNELEQWDELTGRERAEVLGRAYDVLMR